MSTITHLRNLWRNIVHRGRVERDLDDELRSVFEQLVAEKTRAGMSPPEARRQATLQLGRLESLKAQVRESRSSASLETLWHDIRFAARLLRRTPAFALAAIVSLALGLGANSAVFGLVNALQLRTLPVAHAEELGEIRLDGPRCCRHTGRNRQVSLPLWQEIVKRQRAFESLFAFADTRFNLAPQGEVRYVEGLYVSGEFFPVLGVVPALGRTLGVADDQPGCKNAGAVISDALWRTDFGARPDVLSQTLTLRTTQHPIVGVMPAGFFGVEIGRRFDVALPLCVYGIVSYAASSRQREIGIRLALGARATDVVRTVLGRVALVGGAGLLCGAVLTLVASAAAQSFVFGVEPGDPGLLLLIVAFIITSAAAAASVPVRRALRTDPVVSLKAE